MKWREDQVKIISGALRLCSLLLADFLLLEGISYEPISSDLRLCSLRLADLLLLEGIFARNVFRHPMPLQPWWLASSVWREFSCDRLYSLSGRDGPFNSSRLRRGNDVLANPLALYNLISGLACGCTSPPVLSDLHV